MGDSGGPRTSRTTRRLAAALAVAALTAGVVGYAQRYGLDADSRFRHWLEQAPGVVSIDRFEPRRPAPPGSSEKPTVPAPSAEVTLAGPLTPARIAPFQRAFEAYAADHRGDFRSFSVQAGAGQTVVIVTPDRSDNERRSTVLAAFQSLPRLVGARLAWSPWPAETVAVLPAQTDLLPALLEVQRRLAQVSPQPPSWGETGTEHGGLVFRVAGTRHQLAADTTSVPTPRALRAFAVAVHREDGRAVELAVSSDGGDGQRALLSLDPRSPTGAGTAAAVNAEGFGIPGHREHVQGAGRRGTVPFDTAAWSARALPPVRGVTGVRDARLALEGGDDDQGAVLDVQLGAGATPATLVALGAVVPDGTDTVRAHTVPTALDPHRDSALPEDPEQLCPAGRGDTPNTAYTGPASEFPAAAALMSRVAEAAPLTCAHWQLSDRATPDQAPALEVRVPDLAATSWRPVIDALASLPSRTGGRPAPRVALILPAVARPWTAVLLATPGDPDAHPSTLVADSPVQMREATMALEPLVVYWRAAVTSR